MDAPKLGQVPVFGWVINYDAEQPIAKNATKAYDEGPPAHLGFAVWDGKKFVAKQQLPRSLWLCRPTPTHKAKCYYERLEDDAFTLQQ